MNRPEATWLADFLRSQGEYASVMWWYGNGKYCVSVASRETVITSQQQMIRFFDHYEMRKDYDIAVAKKAKDTTDTIPNTEARLRYYR